MQHKPHHIADFERGKHRIKACILNCNQEPTEKGTYLSNRLTKPTPFELLCKRIQDGLN